MAKKLIKPQNVIPVDIQSEMKEVKGFLGEFQKFVMRGNVVDLAVGIVIGAAFKDIVNSLVSDIIMPPLGLLTSKVDFSSLYLNLSNQTFETLAEAETAGAPIIKYGMFINSIIDFVIIAFVIFLIVRQVNRIEKKEKEKAVASKQKCPYCMSEIDIKASKCPFCTSKLSSE